MPVGRTRERGRGRSGGLNVIDAQSRVVEGFDRIRFVDEIPNPVLRFLIRAVDHYECGALRGPVDAFFDKVLVNSEKADERANRLRLLSQVRDAMGRVAVRKRASN